MLFRRVRDEHGNLQLSKAAADFHPGRGVYRSSYMNARRLAATETNIAYRTADHERWKKMDFVVGIEIHLSNNHNCKGIPKGMFYDICDDLKGRYPKDFKFTGWHPHCRCYATSILKTDEEVAEDTKKMLRGEEVTDESKNTVEDVPDGFKQWVKENEERAKTHYSVPYFVKDNMKYVPKELMDAYGSRLPYDTFAEYEAAMRYNKKHSNLTKEQMENVRELNKVMPVVQGKEMNFTEADHSKNNPDFDLPDARTLGFEHNCQTCTMAFELRRRGFDVEARANPVAEGYKKSREFDRLCFAKHAKWTDRFLYPDGTKITYEYSSTAHLADTSEARLAYIRGKITDVGRYEVYCGWKGGSAHVFIVEKTKDGDLLWYDPQSGHRGKSIQNYADRMRSDLISVVRIDDKIVNPKFASRLIKARK